jgi:hypothetical protein
MVKARLSRDRPAFKRADSCVAASLTARTERYTSTSVHARTVGPQTTLRAVPPSRLQRLAAVAWQQNLGGTFWLLNALPVKSWKGSGSQDRPADTPPVVLAK